MKRDPVRRALVIEDDAALRASLVSALEQRRFETAAAETIAAALAYLETTVPDLLIADYRLPDGEAPAIFEALSAKKLVPTAIAMSAHAAPREAFQLARFGVRTYLQKPFDMNELEQALDTVLSTAPDALPIIRGAVGKVPLPELEDRVRTAMVEEAMARSGGSRHGAARLLGVSRQFMQHVLRKLSDDDV